mgnify:CR=1 FL=1
MRVSNTVMNEHARLRALIESAIAEWMPAYQSGEEVNGADLVDFFGEFLAEAQHILIGKGPQGWREIEAGEER